MAKLTKAEFNHLVKKHIKAERVKGQIRVALNLQCDKGCTSDIHSVKICRYPPCPY